MMIPPYLRAEELVPNMRERPDIPFFVRPRDYRIVDGDTIRLLSPQWDSERKKRFEAFRIRFPHIDAPELPWPRLTDNILKRAGIEPNKGNAGLAATAYLRKICADRCLLIIPQMDATGPKCDRYHRLIASVIVSGAPGADFDLTGAYDVEHHMYRKGHAQMQAGHDLPPAYPVILENLKRLLEQNPQIGQDTAKDCKPDAPAL